LYSYIADGSPFGGNLFINDTGDQLDVMGTLYLQKLSLGNIDIFSGLIVLDDNGNITTSGIVRAAQVETDKLTMGGSVGTATIKVETTSILIPNSQVTEDSKIFTSPTTPTGGQSLIIISKVAGESFLVEIENPYDEDITFDYWIIN